MTVKKVINSDIYDFAVIGNGIMAKLTILRLLKMNPQCKIVQLYNDESFPPCSLATTATVSTAGIELGVGELGDKILMGHQSFLNFINEYKIEGVTEAFQYIVLSGDERKDKRFYTGQILKTDFINDDLEVRAFKGHLINPIKFYRSIDKMIDNFKVDRYKHTYLFHSRVNNLYQIDGAYQASKLYICTGAYRNLLDVDTKSKPISGSFIEFDHELTRQSFWISYGSSNLIYKKEEGLLQIGGTTIEEGHNLASNFEGVENMYHQFERLVSFKLPSLNTGKIITGLREKGRKRHPIEVHNHLGGLYKNGFTLSFYLADRL